MRTSFKLTKLTKTQPTHSTLPIYENFHLLKNHCSIFMKACQYVLRVNHRQYLVLINPTKLIFCPIFEGDATRRGG